MQIVERKPVPIYEVICFECGSKLRYQASEVNYCHIICPVCHTPLWAMTINPVAFEDTEPPKGEHAMSASGQNVAYIFGKKKPEAKENVLSPEHLTKLKEKYGKYLEPKRNEHEYSD